MNLRKIDTRYDDPVDLIWIRAAADLGLMLHRSKEVFAAYDGQGTLTIAEPDDFDADDCLAQMIFHEICHWLVAGRRGFHLEDWGLNNIDDRDVVFEYAAIRVQAALAMPFGLRDFMAVTTDWRPYWNTLPADSLADGEDPAIPLARDGYHLAKFEPFMSVLANALSATAKIADVVREFSPADSLWQRTRARHRLGSLLHRSDDLRCGTCAWAVGESTERTCQQHVDGDDRMLAVDAGERACERWEPVFSIDDCGQCGACCREGFDVLAVAPEDEFKQRYPDLVQLRDDGEYCVPRPNGQCMALNGDGSSSSPYRCQHYQNRPRNCKQFEVGGAACLVARRRVGLSR